MTNEMRLQELLARWEQARERGEPVTPEELCRHHPELLEEFSREVRGLERLAQILAISEGSPPQNSSMSLVASSSPGTTNSGSTPR